MRIAYCSDLHLEHWRDDGPEIPACDLLILAGDISVGQGALYYRDRCADKLGIPVVFVPGNHEYYGSDFDEMRAKLLKGGALDRGTTEVNGKRIAACTLWTDYKISGDQAAAMFACENALNDHRLIQGLTPERALEEHKESRAFLAANPADIIVTHHNPSLTSRNQRFSIDHVTAGFVSDLPLPKGVVWIFGHDHQSGKWKKDGCRLMTAQRGYPGERCGWNGVGVVEVE